MHVRYKVGFEYDSTVDQVHQLMQISIWWDYKMLMFLEIREHDTRNDLVHIQFDYLSCFDKKKEIRKS